jgi:hypothetical protein
MSVNFSVRRVNEKLLAALRRAPSILSALCGSSVDFDPAEYESEFFEGVSPARREERRAHFEQKLGRFLGFQRDDLTVLASAGVDAADVGQALHFEREWWGMESMIATPIGCRLLEERRVRRSETTSAMGPRGCSRRWS